MCFTPLCTTPQKGGASQCGEGCACVCMAAKSQRTLRRAKYTPYHWDKINHAILLTDYNGDTEILKLGVDTHSLCSLPAWQEIFVELSLVGLRTTVLNSAIKTL